MTERRTTLPLNMITGFGGVINCIHDIIHRRLSGLNLTGKKSMGYNFCDCPANSFFVREEVRNETHVSAEETTTTAGTWIFGPDADARWARRPEAEKAKG